jgi:hypothetical protein
MKKPTVHSCAPDPNSDAATDRQLGVRLELGKILHETRERVERSRLMLAENYSTICSWWWFTDPTRRPAAGMEGMPADGTQNNKTA